MKDRISPVISVVIRCRDEVQSIGPVIEGVLEQRGAPPFEVLAVDSGSRDGTLDLLARLPVRVHHLAPGTFSYGHALNFGAAAAHGTIVVFLSAHSRPLNSHWLARLVKPFDVSTVVATFGRQVPIDGVNPIEAITTRRNFPGAAPAAVRFSNANGALRRASVLERPFDEEIPIAEDHLWACGLRPEERIVYVPDAVVYHSHPMTAEHWRARFYAHGLAAEYARRRRRVELPWGFGDESPARVVFGRALPFLRLATALMQRREYRALTRLPRYALARTVSYTRGLRDGARRYSTRLA
jgi:glycosyltransferase involved in cell wall biosynthesis